MTKPYRIVGSLGSPYSMKMRAVFRYRRLAHVFEMRNGAVGEEVADVRPAIIPMVRGPGDAGWWVDTTPIIYELEARHAARSILPVDAGDRFLAELIEDFGDEWLTKAMFHYRWDRPVDQDFGAAWIAADHVTGIEDAEEVRAARRDFAEEIADRQISRMPLVGCTEENRGVIERTYEGVLDALESHVGFGRFLFGSRPSIGDFGLFGQLKTLGDDPTPQALMRARAPTVCHWVRQVDDLSGHTGAWRGDGAYPDAVRSLLVLCGEAYLPFLSANAAAVESGAEEVVLDIWGQRYAQAPFRYQAKCYARLRNLYAALSPEARARLAALLDETGCLGWLD